MIGICRWPTTLGFPPAIALVLVHVLKEVIFYHEGACMYVHAYVSIKLNDLIKSFFDFVLQVYTKDSGQVACGMATESETAFRMAWLPSLDHHCEHPSRRYGASMKTVPSRARQKTLGSGEGSQWTFPTTAPRIWKATKVPH